MSELETQGYTIIKQALAPSLIAELREVIEHSPTGVRSISNEHKYNDRCAYSLPQYHAPIATAVALWCVLRADRCSTVRGADQGDHLYIGFSDDDVDREGGTRHDVYAHLIGSPGLAEAFERAGLHSAPKYWSGSVMSKPPAGPPLYWHHDWAFWDCPTISQQAAGHQIFAMVYLTDTSRANGCLRVLPGSHLHRSPLHDDLAELMNAGKGPAHGGWGQSAPWENEGRTSALFCDPPGAVDVCVKAGDVVIGDSRLLHAAHPNSSAERRTGLTLWFIADWEALPPPFQVCANKISFLVPFVLEFWKASRLYPDMLKNDDGKNL
jgi:hypothetical protein